MLPVIGLLLVIGVTTAFFTARTSYNDLSEEAREDASSEARLVVETLRLADELMSARLQSGIDLLEAMASQLGPARLSGVYTLGAQRVPGLFFGSHNQTGETAIVDEVAGTMGGMSTLFVRSGIDFVRVSTNVKTTDGGRATGTTLSQSTRAYAALMEGKPYFGTVDVVGQQYLGAYAPIRDGTGNIIGASFSGQPITAFERLGELMADGRVLEKGFVALLNADGMVLFHSSNMTAEGISAAAESTDWELVRAPYENWGYTVVAGIYHPEVMQAVIHTAFATVLGIVAVLFLLVGTMWFILRHKVQRRVGGLLEIATKIGAGDLDVRVPVDLDDEIGRLGTAFNKMVEGLQDARRKGMVAQEKAEENARAAQDLARASEAERNYLAESTALMLREMERFSAGDLTASLSATKNDEIGKLFAGFNDAVANIRRTIEEVHAAVEATASSATQISASSEELAAGAQEQSAQSGEVAAAVEEMVRTIMENTRSAGEAAGVAEGNGAAASEGSRVVAETVEKIEKIADVVRSASETVLRLGASSREIGEITEVIDGIADQTNLLALNAAIEAARAGEHGRGFAVVADEVRKLAERTGAATKKIADMVAAIQHEAGAAVVAMKQGGEEVESGIDLAGRARASLEKVVGEAQSVVDRVTQIAAASEEQSATSEQIARSVDAISTVSHESALGVSQIAQLADGLNRLTDDLRRLLQGFELGGTRTETVRLSKSHLAPGDGLPSLPHID